MHFHDFQTHFSSDILALNKIGLRELFAQDPTRTEALKLQAAGISLDYSRQYVSTAILEKSQKWLDEMGFKQKIAALFAGEKINLTENRAVSHPALRLPQPAERVHRQHQKMFALSEAFRSGSVKGASGKVITDIVNIGIGGSDLGPRMVVRALRPYQHARLKVHFVANVDGTDLFETLAGLNPETTGFIIASKTFTTEETLLNAKSAKAWLTQALGPNNLSAHFMAATSAPEKAMAWGVSAERIFEMWDDIGGRYSLWSTIGLPICLAIGHVHFQALLAGAHSMDEHFQHADFAQNMPVLLALIAIFNQNILGAESHAVIPYDQTLELLPAYLQQADMESNGKRVTRAGMAVDYPTGAALWGGVGTNGQHAFHQLFHQGTRNIPIDFILPLESHHPWREHHLALMANCYGQIEALLQGRDQAECIAESLKAGMDTSQARLLAPHKEIPGNKPCNLITCTKLTPETLGALVALYEHKIFMQSLLWDINAFDQWGVELGKVLARPILKKLLEQSQVKRR